MILHLIIFGEVALGIFFQIVDYITTMDVLRHGGKEGNEVLDNELNEPFETAKERLKIIKVVCVTLVAFVGGLSIYISQEVLGIVLLTGLDVWYAYHMYNNLRVVRAQRAKHNK